MRYPRIMVRKRKFLFILLCGVLSFLTLTFFTLNFLTNWESRRYANPPDNRIEGIILELHRNLPASYFMEGNDDEQTHKFLSYMEHREHKMNMSQLWNYTNSVINKKCLYPQNELLGALVNAMKIAKIIEADLDRRGTQLKFLLTLEGGQKVVFKPKWYKLDKIIEGSVYAGKDRFGAEVLAFYLSAILHKPLVPVSVARRISIKEILSVASKELLSTTFNSGDSTCIYGKCFYCKRDDPICAESDGFLTGAVIFNLNFELKNHRSPWQRTYKANKKAFWQIKENYCQSLKHRLSKTRLYDLVDVAIFDFLIQNGDRHHYETFQDAVMFLDNGKGLGNPNVHHLDILAPLYQCCLIRRSSWHRLLELANGKLKQNLRAMPDIQKITTENHISAIEKRLLLVYATMEYCKRRRLKNS